MIMLRINYTSGMNAAISEAKREFHRLAPGRLTTAMGIMSTCMSRILSMPDDLIEIVKSYADFIDEYSLVEVLTKCGDQHKPWIRSLIIMAIGTDNLEVFKRLRSLTNPDANEIFDAGDLEEFMWMPDSIPHDEDFIQFVTNLLCYLGRAGRNSEWVTEFFRERSSVKFGVNYMVRGSGSPDAIQYNMEIA